MTIIAGDVVFPENACALIAARIKPAIDGDLYVARRPLRKTDPSQSVGVFGMTVLPDEDSIEIPSLEPTVNKYVIIIQTMVKDSDEENGISIHSILSKLLRSMYYRDAPLHAGLTALAVDMNNSRERMQRRGVNQQRLLSSEVQGSFVYSSWLETYLETETISI